MQGSPAILPHSEIILSFLHSTKHILLEHNELICMLCTDINQYSRNPSQEQGETLEINTAVTFIEKFDFGCTSADYQKRKDDGNKVRLTHTQSSKPLDSRKLSQEP
jgi:hypothetical protein